MYHINFTFFIGVTQLPDFKVHFPTWSKVCLDEQMDGNLDANGLDLLDK